MDPKFGFTALATMLSTLQGFLSTSVSAGSFPPFLALITTGKTDFPVGEDEDLWSAWSSFEATFKGYSRVMLSAGDFPAITIPVSDDHWVCEIPQQEFAYDSGDSGADSEEIGWVVLVGNRGNTEYCVFAAVPITPTLMDGDGKFIRAQMNLRAFSLPYPPP